MPARLNIRSHPLNVAPNNAVMFAQDSVRESATRLDRAVNMTTRDFDDGAPLLGMRPHGAAWNWAEAEQAVRFANRLADLLEEFNIGAAS